MHASTSLLLILLPFTLHAQDSLPGMLMSCINENQFALTFDDGPSEFTTELLQTLDEEHVPATFFVLGTQVDNPQFQPVLKDIHARGHQIGVHTYDHPHLNSLSMDQVRDQLTRTDTAIRNVIGMSPLYMRPPFGECSAAVQSVVQEMGYTIVQWNLDSNDWRYMDQGERAQAMVTQNFVKELRKIPDPTSVAASMTDPNMAVHGMAVTPAGNPEDPNRTGINSSADFTIPHLPSYISLQHDTQGFSVRQTRRIIQEIKKKKGYKFVSVVECAGGIAKGAKPMYRNGPDSVFKAGILPPTGTATPPPVSPSTGGQVPKGSAKSAATQNVQRSHWSALLVSIAGVVLTWTL